MLAWAKCDSSFRRYISQNEWPCSLLLQLMYLIKLIAPTRRPFALREEVDVNQLASNWRAVVVPPASYVRSDHESYRRGAFPFYTMHTSSLDTGKSLRRSPARYLVERMNLSEYNEWTPVRSRMRNLLPYLVLYITGRVANLANVKACLFMSYLSL